MISLTAPPAATLTGDDLVFAVLAHRYDKVLDQAVGGKAARQRGDIGFHLPHVAGAGNKVVPENVLNVHLVFLPLIGRQGDGTAPSALPRGEQPGERGAMAIRQVGAGAAKRATAWLIVVAGEKGRSAPFPNLTKDLAGNAGNAGTVERATPACAS